MPDVVDDLASRMLADGRAAGPTLALGGDVGVGLVTDTSGRTRVESAAVEAEPPKKRAYHRRKPSYRGGEQEQAGGDGEHTPLSQVILRNRSGKFQYKDLLEWATTNRETKQLIDGIDTGRKTVSGANIAKLEQLIRAHKGEDGDGAGKACRPAERAGALAAATGAHRKSDDDKTASWYFSKAAKGRHPDYKRVSGYFDKHRGEFADCTYPGSAGGSKVYGAMGDEFVRRLRAGAGISQVGEDAGTAASPTPTRAGAPPVEKAKAPEISRSASVPIGQVFMKAADGSPTTAKRIGEYFWEHKDEFGPGDGVYVSPTGNSARVDKKCVKDLVARFGAYGAPPEEKHHAAEEGPPRTGGAADELRTDGLHRSRNYVTKGPGLELDIFIRQMPAADRKSVV